MAEKNIAVKVQNLTKSFRIPLEASTGLKQKLINTLKGRKGYRTFTPLNDISFEIEEGDFFGIVGRNGSGKSTLLKTIAGIYAPNKGGVFVNGTLVPFIELGVGFNPELTGRENIYLNGALLGFSHEEMDKMYDDIVEFAELQEFMDERLKNYSSGMQVRLAFSIAIRAKGDILLLDEVLAVGDVNFQKKCYEYFRHLKKEKKTVIFVSHDIGALEKYCNKGILLEKGKIHSTGNIDKILNNYKDVMHQEKRIALHEDKNSERLGNGRIRIDSVELTNKLAAKYYTESNTTIDVAVKFVANDDIKAPIYSVTVYDSADQRIFISNNSWIHKKVTDLKKGNEVKVLWKIPNIFTSGEYVISITASGEKGEEIFDDISEAAKFEVKKKNISNAYTNVEHEMLITNT